MSDWRHPSTCPVGQFCNLLLADRPNSHEMTKRIMGPVVYGYRLTHDCFKVAVIEGEHCEMTTPEVVGWQPLPDAPEKLPEAPDVVKFPEPARTPNYFPAA